VLLESGLLLIVSKEPLPLSDEYTNFTGGPLFTELEPDIEGTKGIQ